MLWRSYSSSRSPALVSAGTVRLPPAAPPQVVAASSRIRDDAPNGCSHPGRTVQACWGGQGTRRGEGSRRDALTGRKQRTLGVEDAQVEEHCYSDTRYRIKQRRKREQGRQCEARRRRGTTLALAPYRNFSSPAPHRSGHGTRLTQLQRDTAFPRSPLLSRSRARRRVAPPDLIVQHSAE